MKKLFIILLILFSSVVAESAVKDKEVTDMRRITHPNWMCSPNAVGISARQWNSDSTMIMAVCSYKGVDSSLITGRNAYQFWVTSVATFATFDFDDDLSYAESEFTSRWTEIMEIGASYSIPDAVFWSPHSGEENIIYFANEDTGELSKCDVSTPSSPSCSTVTSGASFTTNAGCFGWSKEATPRLLCHTVNPTSYNEWVNDGTGYYINTSTGVLTTVTYPYEPPYFSGSGPTTYTLSQCAGSGSNLAPDFLAHGHSGDSPSGDWHWQLSRAPVHGITDTNTGTPNTDCFHYMSDEYDSVGPMYPFYMVHGSWQSDEDYFITNTTASTLTTKCPSAPSLQEFQIWQVYFDSTTHAYSYNQLLPNSTYTTMLTPTKWDSGGNDCASPCESRSTCALNWESHFNITERSDGNQIAWSWSGDGNYGYRDNTYQSSTPWSYPGIYVADLATPTTNTTLTISAPDGVTVTAGDDYNITYTLADSDQVVTMDCYYETSPCSQAGGTIVPKPTSGTCSTLPEGTNATCAFETNGITAGTYYIYCETSTGEGDTCSNGTLTINDASNALPTLSISQPAGGDDTVASGSSFSITYTLTDGDSVATVDFYYTQSYPNAVAGINGTQATGCQGKPEGTDATCSWDTTGMSAGDYYVYGLADDTTNPPVVANSSSYLTVTVTTPPAREIRAGGRYGVQ